MRHVTDGELHAFLDGGLDLLPDGRGEKIRAHIADCPVCRERLQDEEAVRSEAEGILGDPDLSDVSLPTFEELRERAEAPLPQPLRDERETVRYRGPLRGLPLAWAATIVLALGVGWMGSEVFSTLPQAGGRLTPASRLRAVTPTEATLGDRESDSPPGVEVQEAGATPAPPESEGAPGPSAAQEDALRLSSPVVTGDVVVTGRVDEAREQEDVPAGAEFAKVEAARAAAPPALQEEVVILPDSATDLSPLGFAAARQVRGVGVLASEAVPGTDSMAYSSAVPGLAVPGFEVASFEWEERVPGLKALLIRQVHSPGDTLELHYLGLLLGTEPEARREAEPTAVEEASGQRIYANALEASLPPGWTQVVMERGRGLLVARAPTDENHLKALLKTLR